MKKFILPVALVALGVVLAVAAFIYKPANGTDEEWYPEPVRVHPAPEVTVDVSEVLPLDPVSDTEEPERPLMIAGSDILHVEIPAVAIDIGVSGETWPRQTKNCHATVECIDPPVANQAAWYGHVPATPSTDTVRIFAHNTPHGRVEESFNNLPAMVAGDEIIVTTETGIFTYRAEDPELVRYEDVPYSEFVWGSELDRVVLVTCNNREVSATVVEAWLVNAVPLG